MLTLHTLGSLALGVHRIRDAGGLVVVADRNLVGSLHVIS